MMQNALDRPDQRGRDTTVPDSEFAQTVVDLGTCNCSERAPSDFADLLEAIMLFKIQV